MTDFGKQKLCEETDEELKFDKALNRVGILLIPLFGEILGYLITQSVFFAISTMLTAAAMLLIGFFGIKEMPE